MVMEIESDDSFFGVDIGIDMKFLDIRLSFLVFEEHPYHFVLNGIFHALDFQFLAIFNLLLQRFIAHSLVEDILIDS